MKLVRALPCPADIGHCIMYVLLDQVSVSSAEVQAGIKTHYKRDIALNKVRRYLAWLVKEGYVHCGIRKTILDDPDTMPEEKRMYMQYWTTSSRYIYDLKNDLIINPEVHP